MLIKHLLRGLLGAFMIFAGVNHFTNLDSFMAQVPPFFPAKDWIIYISGVIEIFLGFALMVSRKYRKQVGLVLAVFYVVIFPGNISQFLTETPAFGLDSDLARGIRLMFQPILVFLALWSTNFEFRPHK